MAPVTGRPILNSDTGGALASHVELADTFLARLIGLLGRRGLPQGHGLILTRTSSIHMVGMLFAIDVIFTDASRRVVSVHTNVRPFWFAMGAAGADIAIELPVGVIAASGTKPGDRLEW